MQLSDDDLSRSIQYMHVLVRGGRRHACGRWQTQPKALMINGAVRRNPTSDGMATLHHLKIDGASACTMIQVLVDTRVTLHVKY